MALWLGIMVRGILRDYHGRLARVWSLRGEPLHTLAHAFLAGRDASLVWGLLDLALHVLQVRSSQKISCENAERRTFWKHVAIRSRGESDRGYV